MCHELHLRLNTSRDVWRFLYISSERVITSAARFFCPLDTCPNRRLFSFDINMSQPSSGSVGSASASGASRQSSGGSCLSASQAAGAGSSGASQSANLSSSASRSVSRGSSAGSNSSRGSSSRAGGGASADVGNLKIGFLGAGKMTDSLVRGLTKYGNIKPNQIFVAAPSNKNSSKFKEMGCTVTKRNIDLFGRFACDVVFLACHGSVIAQCYSAGGTRPHPLTVNYIPNLRKPIRILSLVTGWNLEQIKQVLLNPEHPKKYQLEIHRIAVNPAVAYGVGIGSIDCDPESKKVSSVVRTLLSSVGSLDMVNAEQMDAACATTGAGLAFSYYYTQALADGGFKMGLSRTAANKFAAKIMECAALAVLESGKHPSELKDGVCGAGGPAIYGIHILDKAEAASGITAAVEASYKRSQELAGHAK